MKKQTIIISDLHIGGGASDPGDDHVYQGQQLERLVNELAQRPQGQAGDIELYINGDFLEFAQTLQDAYRGRDAKSWCSESESVLKLRAILAGHPGIFAALSKFMTLGNLVTVAAGNHDVDLYWESVRRELSRAIHPDLGFEFGSEWVERYDAKLQIAHGHIPDPVNTFKRWDEPFIDGDAEPRLEMCVGTLFMVKFVNFLEKTYPFADNIYPVQRLAEILAKNDKKGLLVVVWAFLRFAARHPVAMSIEPAQANGLLGKQLLDLVQRDDRVAEDLARVAAVSIEVLRRQLRSEETLSEFLLLHWPEISSLAAWDQLPKSVVLSNGDAQNSLGTIVGSSAFGRDSLRVTARNRASKVEATQIVVMGHTHIPDEHLATHKVTYFNPGSWTRYAEVTNAGELTLDDLRDESKFPYSLNYVQIDEPDASGQLRATMVTFERNAGAIK